MRIIAIGFCAAALAAGPAMAQTGGVVVWIEGGQGNTQAGNRLRYETVRGARTDCARAMGRFSNRNGRPVCTSPRDPLRGTRIRAGEE